MSQVYTIHSDFNSETAALPRVQVELNQVTKRYDEGSVALQDVQLSIKEGEFLSFVGPSGCGKSTLLRLIAGLSQSSEGDIHIFSQSPDLSRKTGGVSYVFQDATLMPWCSVLDNVTLPLKLRKVSKEERNKRAKQVLKKVGLHNYSNALPRQLSGGMRMRVSIARALISNPRLLLMDEPFGALDELTRQALQNELLLIREQDPSMTILFVTHNVFEAVFLSSRIVVMSARPGSIASDIDVPVAYPRNDYFRTSKEFSNLVRHVSEDLTKSSV